MKYTIIEVSWIWESSEIIHEPVIYVLFFVGRAKNRVGEVIRICKRMLVLACLTNHE